MFDLSEDKRRDIIYQTVVIHNNKVRKKTISGEDFEGIIRKRGFAQLVDYYGMRYDVDLDINGREKPCKLIILINENNHMLN